MRMTITGLALVKRGLTWPRMMYGFVLCLLVSIVHAVPGRASVPELKSNQNHTIGKSGAKSSLTGLSFGSTHTTSNYNWYNPGFNVPFLAITKEDNAMQMNGLYGNEMLDRWYDEATAEALTLNVTFLALADDASDECHERFPDPNVAQNNGRIYEQRLHQCGGAMFRELLKEHIIRGKSLQRQNSLQAGAPYAGAAFSKRPGWMQHSTDLSSYLTVASLRSPLVVQAEFTAKNPKQNQNKARMPVQLPEESRELPFKSVFYHVRDPRDVIVNGYFYHLSTAEKWATNLRLSTLGGKSYQATLRGLDLEDGLLFEMQGKARHTLRAMYMWHALQRELKVSAKGCFNLKAIRYEDLWEEPRMTLTYFAKQASSSLPRADEFVAHSVKRVGEFRLEGEKADRQNIKNIESEMLKAEGSAHMMGEVDLDKVVTKMSDSIEHSAPMMEAVLLHIEREKKNAREAGSFYVNTLDQTHLRSGKVGQWREYFTPNLKEKFKELYGGILIELGYERSNAW